jgi:hypothetical protein
MAAAGPSKAGVDDLEGRAYEALERDFQEVRDKHLRHAPGQAAPRLVRRRPMPPKALL